MGDDSELRRRELKISKELILTSLSLLYKLKLGFYANLDHKWFVLTPVVDTDCGYPGVWSGRVTIRRLYIQSTTGSLN